MLWLALLPFDIEAGMAAEQLNAWAIASKYHLVTPYTITSELHTNAVKGDYEPVAALNLMLEGTGLTYVWVNPTFVSVFREEKSPPARKPPPSPDEIQQVLEHCSTGWFTVEEAQRLFAEDDSVAHWCCVAYGKRGALTFAQDKREDAETLYCLPLPGPIAGAKDSGTEDLPLRQLRNRRTPD